ncbi:DUF1961 family protein [Metabacillus bambusae]|uniref:DUF1961 family protein n=1 Tax=Metabacillus bambusae TaxID=2795218 RepID=A0ABS3N2H9_9BACI|nr:DUF1961 family protein [Metabacillus bambusae]MBO1512123.1 DUF1961 family protein [Metabacillus bambusae]
MHSYFFERGKRIYKNSLSSTNDIADWLIEGEARVSFEENRLQLENKLDPSVHGDNSHWVFWCPINFPDKVIIEWEFYPIREPGLCMLFFAATGRNGEDLFSPNLPKRNGKYPEYHSGAINALHLSYFRHKHADERSFRTCNLRKSYGFHLAAIGADPLPPVEDAIPPYNMKLIKYEGIVQFTINQLPVLEWEDDGTEFGSILSEGKIGFRQMAPMKAAYSNFQVHEALLSKQKKLI